MSHTDPTPSPRAEQDVTVLIELPSVADLGARVYTIGMVEHGLAELAMEDVRPAALASCAAEIVKSIADYMFTGKARVSAGQSLVIDPTTIVRVEEGGVDDYGNDVWEIVDEPNVFCPECEGGDHVLYIRAPPQLLN